MRSFLVSRVWLVTQSSALLGCRKHRQGRLRCRVPACGLLDVSHCSTRHQPRAWSFCARLTSNGIRADRAFSPMLIGFAITRSLTPHIELLPLLFLTILSSLVEEIEFRGFGVRQLQRGTRWPFWVVAWPSALAVRIRPH